MFLEDKLFTVKKQVFFSQHSILEELIKNTWLAILDQSYNTYKIVVFLAFYSVSFLFTNNRLE